MKHILYAHDQQESPLAVEHLLTQSGYHVSRTSNGEEAPLLIAELQPDLVLIDALVEGCNGFELCTRLRALFSRDEMPLVLTSRIYRSSLYAEAAQAAGAQAFLLRPWRDEELISAMRELL